MVIGLNKWLIVTLASLILSSAIIIQSIYAEDIIEPYSEWITDTSLPYPVGGQTSTTYGDTIYNFSGSSETWHQHPEILTSSRLESNFLDNWVINDVKVLKPTLWASIAKSDRQIYLLGGFEENLSTSTFGPIPDVYLSNFNENGTISGWLKINNLPTPLAMASVATYKDRFIYLSGGYSTNDMQARSEVYWADLDESKNPLIWHNSASLPEHGLYSHGMIEVAGYLYVIGGEDQNGTYSEVYKCRINNDGSLESWNKESSLPYNVRAFGIEKADNYILVIGGYWGNTHYRTNLYARVQSDGKIDSWKTSNFLLPYGGGLASTSILNGFLYYMGGWSEEQMNTTNKVYSTKINPLIISTPSATPTPIPSPTPTPLPTPTPTLVPSPTPTPKPADDKLPIILVPGMTACWNYEALVHDINKENKDWTLNPYATVYSNLIGTLNDAGYETGKKLFVYCYDWRKSPPSAIAGLDEIAEAALAKSPSLSTKKVNLIGHSMGGLIVADYANRNENKVNKAIAVGTPFKGSTLAYKVWEGADLSMYQGFEKVAVDLVMQINLTKYSNKTNEIRQMVPSLQSVLPIYDYIKIAPNKIRPWNKMTWKNEYLPSLDISAIAPRLTTITGVDKDTEKLILVKPRNGEEARQDEWIDGKPVSVEYGKGDTSVLAESGSIENAANVTIPGAGHQELMYTMAGQQEIIKQLGIPGSARIDSVPQYNNALAITIASPATFQVITPDNTVLSPIDNLLVINDPKNGDYKIKITGLATGDYKIIFGRISVNKQSWDEYKGNIRAVGEQTDISFPVDMQAKYLGADPIKKAKDEVTRLIAKIKASHMRKPIINFWVENLESLMRTMDKKPLATQKLVSTIDRLSQGNRWLNWWWWGDREMNKEISDSLALVKSWISQ